jgi:hypothetical protein
VSNFTDNTYDPIVDITMVISEYNFVMSLSQFIANNRDRLTTHDIETMVKHLMMYGTYRHDSVFRMYVVKETTKTCELLDEL